MLGSNLQNARNNCGLTQNEVSEKLYVTRQTVSRWEQNKTLPNIHAIEALSKLYGVSIDSLYAGSAPDEGNHTMKHINYFALFGALLFNIFLFSGIAVVLIVSVASVWLMTCVFALAPLILFMAVVVFKSQPFDWPNALFATIMCPVGIFSIKYSKLLTRNLIAFFKNYFKYNLKLIRH